MKRKKYKIVVNNKLKGSYGAMNPKTNKIEINLKAHKGDARELASTVKHELLHVNHPKMTEKQVYKKSAKTKLSYAEEQKMLAKLRNRKLNYKTGAIKRKLSITKGESVKPGDLIAKMNAQKVPRVKRVSIMGIA